MEVEDVTTKATQFSLNHHWRKVFFFPGFASVYVFIIGLDFKHHPYIATLNDSFCVVIPGT